MNRCVATDRPRPPPRPRPRSCQFGQHSTPNIEPPRVLTRQIHAPADGPALDPAASRSMLEVGRWMFDVHSPEPSWVGYPPAGVRSGRPTPPRECAQTAASEKSPNERGHRVLDGGADTGPAPWARIWAVIVQLQAAALTASMPSHRMNRDLHVSGRPAAAAAPRDRRASGGVRADRAWPAARCRLPRIVHPSCLL
jgi:hypothetical protein